MVRHGMHSVSEHVHLVVQHYNRIAANSVKGSEEFPE